MEECVESDPNTYQYATLHLKNENVDLAISFVDRGGSFSFFSKHLPKKKKVGMIAVKKNPNSYQYIGINLKDDDEIFKSAVQQNKETLRYASERIRKINTHSC